MAAKHHIRRHALQVHHNAGGDGFAVRQQAARWQQETWLPMLERLLDKYDVPGQVIKIPRLELALQTTEKTWGADIAEAALQQIEQALVKQIGSAAQEGSQIAAGDRKVELFLFYLRSGYLPWWTEIEGSGQWQNWLSTFFQGIDETTARPLKVSLTDSRARERLIQNLNEALFWRFVKLLAKNDSTCSILERDWHTIQKAASSSDFLRLLSAQYKNAILLALSREDSTTDINREFSVQLIGNIRSATEHIQIPVEIRNDVLKEALTSQVAMPLADNERAAYTNDCIAHEDPIYISDAGLVIIAPFLKDFFQQVQLLGEGNVITDASKAVALVNYMASGTTYAPETELVLSKLLCGILLEEPISIRDIQLSADECLEADTLLKSVVEHWAALKNTSIEGLRTNFLQREGRLSWKENAWQLKVQQESYDLLLSYIPWSISYIKLPWMNTLLQVEWN